MQRAASVYSEVMTLITDTSSLAALCDRLGNAPYITVDTEFLREKTYWPLLCLVQVAAPAGDHGPDEAHAIDPLAPGIDLAPLFALMANPNVVKVFHAARQDVEIFLHLSGAIPSPIFDTQIAAMVCGFGESVSYENLAASLAKARIDKSMRFTDWALRPLSERQLEYALSDVTHLRVAYEKLIKKLEKNNRLPWLDEEMRILTDPGTYRVEPSDAWRRLKPRSSSPRFLCLLRELAAWREREAQERDLPRQRVLRDEALLEIAAHAPANANDLARTRGLGKPFAEGRLGQAVLAVVVRAAAIPDSDCPKPMDRPDLPRGLGPISELLKVLLKMKCDRHGVAQRLVAASADIDLIASDDDAKVPALQGWRRELFGEDALKLKHGRIALALTPDGRRTRVVEITPEDVPDEIDEE